MLFDSEFQSFVISRGSENFRFCCCAIPTIITLMSMFATYRVKMEQIILFVKILNQHVERKECFSAASVLKFSWRFGAKNFVLVSCSFKVYCKLQRLCNDGY